MGISENILIRYLENPETLDFSSSRSISDLVAKFPFFQTARLLQIKNLQQINNTIDKQTLSLTAAYVTDRKVLYYLLYKFNPASTDHVYVSAPGDHTSAYEKEYKESLKENIAETLSRQRHYYELEPEHEIELIPGLAIDIRKEYGAGIELDNHSFSLGLKKDIPTNDIFELGDEPGSAMQPDQDNDLSTGADVEEPATVDNFFTEMESATLELQEAPLHTPENEPLHETVTNGTISVESQVETVLRNSVQNLPIDESVSSEVSSDPSVSGGIKSFNEWLDSVETSKKVSKVTPEHNQAEASEAVKQPIAPEIHLGNAYRLSETLTEKPESKEKKEKNDSLIDNFIRSNPRILPTQSSEKIEDISAESVKEHESFFTDTLAQIYVKQGNYAKAILAYEKLSLKYPEKSTYFAGQISVIKKHISKS